jgi:DNA-binding MarR family transcriptional regulator
MTGRHVEGATPVLDDVPAVLWESVGFLLSKAADQIERRFSETLRPYGISPRQFGVLASIAHQGPQSQQKLGERLGIDRTSMVNIIDTLEDTKLVTRVRDRDDRRRYAITLSKKGDALLRDKLMAVDAETHKHYLGVLEPGEQQLLLNILRRLVQSNAPRR